MNNYLPFDLKIALAHPERVVTRDGRKVLETHYFSKRENPFRLFAILENIGLETYTDKGRRNMRGDSNTDLFSSLKH